MTSAVGFLVRSQNVDGGWGYRAQSMSYVEPTAAAILALEEEDARGRARDFLLSIQHVDGGWGIGSMDTESGWMTAWAVLALSQFSDTNDAVRCGSQWLIDTEGIRVMDAASRAIIYRRLQIDSTLRGWPWQPGDAAWVHPTALAMLALGAAGNANELRVRDGLAYLFDRAVASGGWNIGNPEMLGKTVPATVQDTAVTLRALRNIGTGADDAHVVQAILFLREQIALAKTPAELAWGIYALRAWSIELGNAPARLSALQSADGSWQGNPFITAIAELASR